MRKLLISVCILFILVLSINTNTAVSADSTLASALAPVVQESFKELEVPGAIIGVWKGDLTPWITTMGVADLQTDQPISVEDKMRIGSITKTFTGTVLLQLVDEGKISLSDKLSKYFPDYPDGDNITIEEIGNMTSGLYNYTEDQTFLSNMQKDLLKPFTPQELIAISEKHAPDFAPGTSMHYSNTNFIILGLIIEKLTGNPLQTEFQNRIFNPLGMKETSFAVNSNFPDPHAHGYIYWDSNAVSPTDVTDLDPSWGWAAGSMISTLEDIHKYAKPLATGQLISPKSQADRLKWGPVFVSPTGGWADKPLRYGFAIADFDGAHGHNGGIPGFNSFMGYIPDKDATIIIFVNMQDNKAGMGPADYLARKIVEKIKQM